MLGFRPKHVCSNTAAEEPDVNQSGVSSRAYMHILNRVVAQTPSENTFICTAITWFAVAIKLHTFSDWKGEMWPCGGISEFRR